MIRYALKCDKTHSFESWFQSAAAFDKLQASGLVTCAVCGSGSVDKAIMAPGVAAKGKDAARPLSGPASAAEQAMAEIRKKIEDSADYVGKDFATEARAIHSGDAPERPIWGEAKGTDAKALIDEGIPVAPLPWMPTRKTN